MPVRADDSLEPRRATRPARRAATRAARLAALGLGLGLGVALASRPARAVENSAPAEPAIEVTLPWLATQLVPSPELAYGQAGARFGMRWQVTPLLWSWGIHRGLSPWRSLVVEPNVRQSGSIELFFSPEYVDLGHSLGDDVVLRTGVRSYFPLIEHGEYLSVSIGASHTVVQGASGAAYEAGAYVLFGTVGVQVTVSPTGGPLATIATLRLRYF